ncbi:MAG TPA: PAS domain S-box protein, partial [Nitrospirota bacterium]|nr:PAS domain S-box protein [Nitrospirota bacterium]
MDDEKKTISLLNDEVRVLRQRNEELEKTLTGAQQLRKQELRFQSLFRQAAIGIAIVDLDGRMVESNKQMGAMLGYSEKELKGRHASDVILAEDLFSDERLFLELREGKSDSYQAVKRCIRKDGTLLWGLFTVSLIHEARDKSSLILWVVDDITDRKEAEEVLARNEARFRQIAETIKEVFWITSPDYSKLLYVSPAYEEIWGRTTASLYENPLSWIEAIHPDDRLRVENSMNAERYEAEFRIMRPNGAVRWIRDRGFPLKDASGRTYRVVGIAEDITERKRTEEALFQSESALRSFYESAPLMMGVVELTEEDDIIHIYDNPATARFFSMPYEDTGGRPAADL